MFPVFAGLLIVSLTNNPSESPLYGTWSVVEQKNEGFVLTIAEQLKACPYFYTFVISKDTVAITLSSSKDAEKIKGTVLGKQSVVNNKKILELYNTERLVFNCLYEIARDDMVLALSVDDKLVPERFKSEGTTILLKLHREIKNK